MLVLPFIVLGFLSYYSSKFAAARVGREYCDANRYEFLAIEIKKANYTLEYKSASEFGRQKFRMAHVFGKVLKVEWLK